MKHCTMEISASWLMIMSVVNQENNIVSDCFMMFRGKGKLICFYFKFIGFLSRFQFLNKTPLAGQRLCFFHPLVFIRNFRKCAWLSKRETLQLIPEFIIRKPGSNNSNNQGIWESPKLRFAESLVDKYGKDLNNSMRKFKIDTLLRQACFIANATQETSWFQYLAEGNRADCAVDLYNGWFGRGFLRHNKCAWRHGGNNYYEYFRFCGRNPSMPPGAQELRWRNEIGRDVFHASHSAGAYWVWSGKSMPSETYPLLPKMGGANKYANIAGINERKVIRTNSGVKVWYCNQYFVNCAASVNYPGSTVQSPPNMNGLVDRSTSFTNALIVLTDVHFFRARVEGI
ncbi:hypothetical protein [Burkholderia ubonensis]|uniref:hypothetical protein n=1 Tax=Burkholderia ubonensis TaxID=101571 RepID=UPI000A62B193|nr:hypothetical protein [Burkholderia ubonensis]